MKIENQNWQISPKEAIERQKTLRTKIKLTTLKKSVRLIGGADVSMNLFATHGFAGFVTLTYPDCTLVDESVVKDKINFPYIPGLLSFREIPMLLQAWEKLKTKPDVIVVDGVGIAHPRRLGIATHLGLLLNRPTIGVSKNVLIGTYKEPGVEPGSLSYMYDQNEIIGAALRTKFKIKPVFISPGHLITLAESIDIIKHCIRKHRLPEPTRLAHNTVNKYRIANNNLSTI